MDQNRRTFLKTSSLAGAAAVAGTATLPTAAAAQTSAAASEVRDLPRNMTFCSLRQGGGYGLGVRTERGILDVVIAEQDFGENAPTTTTAMFQGRGDVGGLRRLIEKARTSPSAAKYFVAEDKAQFGPAVTEPEKIICIGLNYRAHAAETKNPVPKEPILFNKYNTALNHHGGTIAVSKVTATMFDYEAELVIVLGRTASRVSETEAQKCIMGYCTGNDFTARDLQRKSSQWMLGKTIDGSGIIGPWLVGADIADGDNLKIELSVNGETRQSSNTSDMVFNCRQLVSYISQYITLKPGDLIFTGTPSGVISGYPKDKQVWLKPGDKIVTSIEKLGDQLLTLT